VLSKRLRSMQPTSGSWCWVGTAAAQAATVSSARLADLLQPEFSECAFSPAQTAVAQRQSVLVPMADGVRLAVDIYLPKGAAPAARVPTLYTATRYWRSEREGNLTENQKRWIASGIRPGQYRCPWDRRLLRTVVQYPICHKRLRTSVPSRAGCSAALVQR